MTESLLRSYLNGKLIAYSEMVARGVTIPTIMEIVKHFIGDKRTRKFKYWKLGACHAIDEQLGIFFPVPVEIA